MPVLLDELVDLLKTQERFVVDGRLNKNLVVEHALKLDPGLLELLLSRPKIKEHFFVKVKGTLVFDKDKFLHFVDNKQFLPDSYTAFKNKIGFMVGDEYLKDKKDVVLVWPYKDCVLEGGQTKEDQKRDEIFWNETLAPDEIDRLLAPKVLTNFKRYDCEGEHKVTEIKDTDNLIIKGNNLLALHTLKKRFAGKVKLIYIDPPYNTGNDSFGYNDSFNHSTWLTFMKNRLEIAKSLLSSEGAIFVQIDYHEVAYLTVLMNDIFGQENLVQMISVKTASPAGFKTVNPGPIDVTEYLLFYTKDKKKFKFKKNYTAVDYDKNYSLVILNPDDRPEKWKLRSIIEVVYEENGIELGKSYHTANKNAEKKWGPYWKLIRDQVVAQYALNNRDRVVSIRDPHKPTDKLKELLAESKKKPGRVHIYNKNGNEEGNEQYGYILNGGALSFYSNKVRDIDGSVGPTELLTDLWNDISWDGIAKEGGVKLKNGKKPEALIKRIIEIATDSKSDIVLDFFAGSGTTPAVSHKMGHRYIGIEQLDYSENDSVIRLQNVLGKKKKEKGKFLDDIDYDKSGISKAVNWQGGGEFVYCELKQWNEIFVQKIQRAKTKGELTAIWHEMKDKAHLSYLLDIEAFDKSAKEFEQLTLENQKRFLLETLDLNQLYVHYSEMDDADYQVSEEDKRLNRQFYKD